MDDADDGASSATSTSSLVAAAVDQRLLDVVTGTAGGRDGVGTNPFDTPRRVRQTDATAAGAMRAMVVISRAFGGKMVGVRIFERR